MTYMGARTEEERCKLLSATVRNEILRDLVMYAYKSKHE